VVRGSQIADARGPKRVGNCKGRRCDGGSSRREDGRDMVFVGRAAKLAPIHIRRCRRPTLRTSPLCLTTYTQTDQYHRITNII